MEQEFEVFLAAARRGEQHALGELYYQFQPRLLRYIQTRIAGAAEDVAHEVWLDVASGLRRFSGDRGAFAAWVFTIARRRIVDEQRRFARKPVVSLETEMVQERPSTVDVESDVLASLGYNEILEHIKTLPSYMQEVILLRVVSGLDVDEVARTLGKRSGTIRVIAHRAIRKLAERMAANRAMPGESGAPDAGDVTETEPERFKD